MINRKGNENTTVFITKGKKMIHIHYIEYDASHSSTFIFDIPKGHNCWLIILTQTPAIFFVDNEYKEYPPNCAVLYKPNQKIYYRANAERYVNDWIRFETDETYVTATPVPSGVPFVVNDPSYCHKLYQMIVTENILDNRYKDISIDNLLRVLMNKLLESYDHNYISPLYKNLNELKMDIYLNPNKSWKVAQMAARLNISVGYLEGIYKTAFGINCIDDVIRSRIHMAKKHLLYGHFTVAEISSLCGYRSVEHFYRQFKKITGKTPSQFRKNPNQITNPEV